MRHRHHPNYGAEFGAGLSMKKLFALLAITSFSIGIANAQKVFSVEYESQADVKVFVVDYESRADLLVFKEEYESRAGKNDGHWYFVDYESQADKKIFFVEYESQADVKIFFADYSSRAGWENKKLIHHFY